jgi:4-amino-4-deoxy-L-arabinose transferase-like glycosyltransferase
VARIVWLIAAAVAGVLVGSSSGYGYHRDELYFLAAGKHLAWSYADQGPLTPLIARAISEIAPNSLTVLRVPAALAAAVTVLLTGMLAREFGGGRRAQALAAASAAVASIVLVTGHGLSTSTFDLLAWTALTWLVVRAVRGGDDRLWLLAGAVLGVGLLNKPLPAFLAIGLFAGVLVAGPRRLLRNRHVWSGAAIALVLWVPWIAWQAGHGWPQLDVSRSIATGQSTSSEAWWAIVPFQVLIGAGAAPVDGWLRRGRRRLRGWLLAAAIGSSAAVSAVIALPLLPVDRLGPVLAANEDVGETIGWPRLARQNYGEAGAIDRYGPALGLPQAYSGHNAYGDWGPPPDGSAPVIAIGLHPRDIAAHLRGCRVAAHVDNDAGVDNSEQGRTITICRAPRHPWAQEWSMLRHLG